MARPPFDIMRACFMLLAAVVLIMMAETLISLASCLWLIAVSRTEQVGACQGVSAQVREIMTELLTAILALLAASRGGPPPTNGEK
jgi:hypothetical protein